MNDNGGVATRKIYGGLTIIGNGAILERVSGVADDFDFSGFRMPHY